MKRILIHFIFTALLVINTSSARTRNYVTGNGFRACADYIVENFNHSFKPEAVEPNSVIYIEVDSLEYFFQNLFPQIKNPIILISHNGDMPAPGTCARFLDDPRIIMWFGQNCDIPAHPKFFPIPIGIANPKWKHGNPKVFDQILDIVEIIPQEKKPQIYINLPGPTHPIRAYLLTLFKNNPLATFVSFKPLYDYLLEMGSYKYVLSPRGNGLDCHRTWEALLVGAIPIVKTSTLDPLYKDLPVIIVQDWQEITHEFLEQKYQEMSQKIYNRDKLFMDYWLTLIKHYKTVTAH